MKQDFQTDLKDNHFNYLKRKEINSFFRESRRQMNNKFVGASFLQKSRLISQIWNPMIHQYSIRRIWSISVNPFLTQVYDINGCFCRQLRQQIIEGPFQNHPLHYRRALILRLLKLPSYLTSTYEKYSQFDANRRKGSIMFWNKIRTSFYNLINLQLLCGSSYANNPTRQTHTKLKTMHAKFVQAYAVGNLIFLSSVFLEENSSWK